MIEISIEEAARLTGKGKEEFSGIENPADLLDKFKQSIAEKFSHVKETAAAQSLRNGLEKREKQMAAKMGIESFSNWDDLMEQVANVASNKIEGNNEQSEKIKRLSNQISEYKTELKKARTETENVKKDFEHREILSKVTTKAKQHIKSLKYNLPTDPAKQEKALERILAMEFNGRTFKKTDDGFVVLNENGEPIQDETFNDITPEQIAERAVGEMYGVLEDAKPSHNPPPPNGTNGVVFGKEDLTPMGYIQKAKALKESGDKDTLNQLTEQYRKINF